MCDNLGIPDDANEPSPCHCEEWGEVMPGGGTRRSNLDLRFPDAGAQIASSSRNCGTPRNDDSEVFQQSQEHCRPQKPEYSG
jgi:hypothetical protein